MPYSPNFNSENVRLLVDWKDFYKANGQPHDIIEMMDQENTILDDLPFREATDKDGNRTVIREKLPSATWGRLYKGTDFSKSQVTIVKDPVAMLESRSLIDARLLELHQGQQKSYRLQEGRAHSEAMRQQAATAVFYGNVREDPDAVHGLDPRYCYTDAPNVIDAGGTGPETTSIWGIVFGERDVVGIFPKDSKVGLRHRDLGESDVLDPDGKPFRAVQDLYEWYMGLAVCDWRSVVRICNIPVSSLMLKKGDPYFIDLHRMTIIAKNKIPPEKRPRMKWFVNSEVMTALELQASDSGNVTLHYGDLFRSKNVPFLHGAPVRQNDAILTTEEALTAKP